jgi:hypothetical protein
MSGYTENTIADHGVENKGSIMLNKPFRKTELIEKLQQVFARQD